jgi:hypothetical protein
MDVAGRSYGPVIYRVQFCNVHLHKFQACSLWTAGNIIAGSRERIY